MHSALRTVSAAAAVACYLLVTTEVSAQEKPNILFVQCDDLGHDDLGFAGNQYVKTPNLDALQTEAVELTQFYTHPLCAPTRAATLTGRHYLKAGVWGVHGGNDYVNLDETMFAQPIQQSGYTTGFFGKWHSGKTDGYLPWHRGFDVAYKAHLYTYQDNKMTHNGAAHNTQGWTNGVLTDLAIDFMRSSKDADPFLCYVAYLSIHTPLTHDGGQPNAPDEWVGLYSSLRTPGGSDLTPAFRSLLGMVSFMDHNFGRMLDSLEAWGEIDNTFIVFCSDNGSINAEGQTDEEWGMRNCSGMAGCKTRIMENGIRSACLMKWGDRFVGRQTANLSHVVDLFPTFLDVAGVDVPTGNKELDGKSLLPMLLDNATSWPERDLYLSEHGVFTGAYPDGVPFMAIPEKTSQVYSDQTTGLRSGNFKLTKWYPKRDYELFNIPSDQREQNNLASSNSAKRDELVAKLETWYNGVKSLPGSFQPPTFVIGYDGAQATWFQPTGAREASSGVTSDGRTCGGYEAAGNYAMWDIDVRTAGRYEVVFLAAFNQFSGTFEVTLGGQKTATSLTEGNATPRWSNVYEYSFGVFDLREGQTFFRLEMTDAGGGSGAVFAEIKEIDIRSTNAPVTAVPLEETLVIAEGSQMVLSGGDVEFSAVILDPAGGSTAADAATWSVSGGGTVSPSSGSTTTFTSDGTAGEFVVTASLGDKTATARAEVTDMGSGLKVNCGGPDIEEWVADDPYIVAAHSGSLYDFEVEPSLSGVTDPAPASVYPTVRHQSGVGQHIEYSFPMPNGKYTVRLHFSDSYDAEGTQRNMSFSIEDQEVLTGFNIVATAGQNQAVVKEYTVTVDDGNGLQVKGENGGNDVFVSGIEITAGSASSAWVTHRATAGEPWRILQTAGGDYLIAVSARQFHSLQIVNLNGAVVQRFFGKRQAVYKWRPTSCGVYFANMVANTGSGDRVLRKRIVVCR